MMKHYRRKIYRDPELIEQIRQFSIVCEVELRIRQKRGAAYRKRNLTELGREHFGLNKTEAAVCSSRARDALDRRMRMPPIGN